MYNAFLQRTKETLSALVSHIQISDSFRNATFNGTLECASTNRCLGASLGSPAVVPDKTEWRKIDHCAAITRVYAIYEQFAQEMIREHLTLLQRSMIFKNLPHTVQNSYRIGMSLILEKKDGPRFGDLDLERLIVGYGNALSGQDYILEPKAMLVQEQNLRLPELHRLMNACGIDDVQNWVSRHSAIADFFSVSGRLTTTAESQLAELVTYRNDAAHGSIEVDTILHPNSLIEYCEFVSSICHALSERIQLAGLKSLAKSEKAQTRGKVTELIKHKTVSIGKMTGSFALDDVVYLCGENYCLERRIKSIQLEGIPHGKVNLVDPTELGLMFDAPGKMNAEIMVFVASNPRSDVEFPSELKVEDAPIGFFDAITPAVGETI